MIYFLKLLYKPLNYDSSPSCFYMSYAKGQITVKYNL